MNGMYVTTLNDATDVIGAGFTGAKIGCAMGVLPADVCDVVAQGESAFNAIFGPAPTQPTPQQQQVQTPPIVAPSPSPPPPAAANYATTVQNVNPSNFSPGQLPTNVPVPPPQVTNVDTGEYGIKRAVNKVSPLISGGAAVVITGLITKKWLIAGAVGVGVALLHNAVKTKTPQPQGVPH